MNEPLKIVSSCNECGRVIDITIAQTIINGDLRWYKSYLCSFCGSAIEQDGTGYPPNEIRKMILDKEGEWSILFEDNKVRKASIMKVLRKTFDMTISQANQALKQFPFSSISGTRAEMSWLRGIFENSGIKARLIRKKV